MKRLLALATVLAAVVSSQSPALAQAKYGLAGCGLGSVIMGPDGSQSSAATSNGLYFNNGFGITSGTSNCMAPEAAAAQMKQEDFMLNNLQALAKEAAQGNGETLATFASTLGCDQAAFAEFASYLQQSYGKIFTQPGAMAILDASKREIKRNSSLANACSKLG